MSDIHNAIIKGLAKELRLKQKRRSSDPTSSCYHLIKRWYQWRKWKWGTWKCWATIYNDTLEIGNMYPYQPNGKTIHKFNLNDPSLIEQLKKQINKMVYT
jgi:hypothetical protein